MKVLVVYFSRTGNTRKVAQAVAEKLGAAIEEITDRVDRRGILGYLRSASGGWFGGDSTIDQAKFDPALFDLVIIGTPIWRFSVSTPVNHYIENHATKFNKVAFFCTMGGSGNERTFRQMQSLCGKVPVATMAIREAVVKQGQSGKAIEVFTGQVRAAAPSFFKPVSTNPAAHY
jgi:flavodoxin